MRTTKALEEIEKLKFDFWRSEEKIKVQQEITGVKFRAWKKEKNKFAGMCSKNGHTKNKILELLEEYNK